jgi:integrase/recombinase XerD
MKSNEYIKEFEERMRCCYSSEATISNYLCATRAFFLFVAGRPETDPAILLRKYITIKLQGKEAKTVNLHRAAIIKFFKLVKGIELDVAAVPRRKEPKKYPRIISGELVQLAIEKTENLKHNLVISIFYGCGLRLCEIQNMRRKNIFDQKNFIWLEDTKGKKHRIVPIPESIRENFYTYIKNMKTDDLIFGNLCKRTFEKIVNTAFIRIGKKASPHMLRHSFATDQVSSGQNIAKVQAWLGHSSLKTTQIYFHLSEAQLSESTDLLKHNYTNQMGV